MPSYSKILSNQTNQPTKIEIVFHSWRFEFNFHVLTRECYAFSIHEICVCERKSDLRI